MVALERALPAQDVQAPALSVSAREAVEASSDAIEDAAAPIAMPQDGGVVAMIEGGAPDDGFVWPEGTVAAPPSEEGTHAVASDAAAPLPALDELVQRVPAETREVLDELFRAKFVSVRRVPKSALKH